MKLNVKARNICIYIYTHIQTYAHKNDFENGLGGGGGGGHYLICCITLIIKQNILLFILIPISFCECQSVSFFM